MDILHIVQISDIYNVVEPINDSSDHIVIHLNLLMTALCI